MSHKRLRHCIVSDARVWDFLKQVDAAEAEACRASGCPRCGGTLHSATYPRKPHGLARNFATMSDASACAVLFAGAA